MIHAHMHVLLQDGLNRACSRSLHNHLILVRSTCVPQFCLFSDMIANADVHGRARQGAGRGDERGAGG